MTSDSKPSWSSSAISTGPGLFWPFHRVERQSVELTHKTLRLSGAQPSAIGPLRSTSYSTCRRRLRLQIPGRATFPPWTIGFPTSMTSSNPF